MKKDRLFVILVCFVVCSVCFNARAGSDLTLWYQSHAQKWMDAFPIGNGRMAAMCFGGTGTERFQINEESLWAGCQSNPYAENYRENLQRVQAMVLSGDYAKAHDFGLENLTVSPSSFRSYEPFCDLMIEMEEQGPVSDYQRELDLATGICRVSYTINKTEIIQESFISALDDVLCIRIQSTGKMNCAIRLQRHKDAKIRALANGSLYLDGQIVDIEAPAGYDDNPGGSGKGGKHMRFAGRLVCKASGGKLTTHKETLVVDQTHEVVLLFTAATDYNLSQLNFDPRIDPGKKADQILEKGQDKSWQQLKEVHIKEHRSMFNRVTLDLGPSPNDSMPTDKRLQAFQDGKDDNGLIVQLFQFGRYLLMSSSRQPATLPANLQGKWNEKEWAPWEADYHLNVNMQMNYWPADVTNLSETTLPLINWLEQIAEISKPLAREMYGAGGWFSCHANNPFGRVTPSASWPISQLNNGVLDPLAGAWMLMNLWDHYEFTQNPVFLEETLYPMLKGASQFILDVLITDSNGTLQFVPSTSPENLYVDKQTGRKIRITSSSSYHLSIIRAVFKATVDAASILNVHDDVCRRITEAESRLPAFTIDKNGRFMEWRQELTETEPGHRHLSHLLGVHPFSLITTETPELFAAAEKGLDWRQENGQGGGGWSCAHRMLMHARFLDGQEAYDALKTLVGSSMNNNMLNGRRVYQIDGNFGVTAGVAEMLIQSHLKDKEGNFIIHLLPAVPSKWQNGSVKGLRARGGFEVDVNWQRGKVLSTTVRSKKGGACKIRFKDRIVDLTLKPGQTTTITDI